MKRVIIYSLLFIFLFSCSDEIKKKHRLLIDRDTSGKIISKSVYYISNSGDSLLDGTTIHYYPNGNVEDSFRVIDGDRDGEYLQYDTSGYLKGKMIFLKGKINGFAYSFYKNKMLEIEEFYKEGKLIFTKNFYQSGMLKSYFIMKNRKESCYYLIKDSIGNIIEQSGDSANCR